MPAQPYSVSSSLEERLKGRRTALEVLRNLPEGYQLYYNPSLRGKDSGDHADPAVDYVIAHRENGLLGVVVKSGEIVEEPGGFISQYQPQKQLYKIIDPVKPADLAMRALLEAFDTDAARLYPCGVVVLFPDTARHEFSSPKSCYVFAEDLAAPDFSAKLADSFLEPADTGDQAKFRANFSRLSEFLKSHSDNSAIFEDTQKRIKQAVVQKATPPVASQLRMKVAAEQGLAVPPPEARVPELQIVSAPPEAETGRPSLKERVEKVRIEKSVQRSKAEEEKSLVAAALAPMEVEKSLAITKAEKTQATIAMPAATVKKRAATSLRVAPVQASRQRDMFAWLEEVQERGEGDAWLTTSQWIMAAGVAVFLICGIYFMAQNFAIATAAG